MRFPPAPGCVRSNSSIRCLLQKAQTGRSDFSPDIVSNVSDPTPTGTSFVGFTTSAGTCTAPALGSLVTRRCPSQTLMRALSRAPLGYGFRPSAGCRTHFSCVEFHRCKNLIKKQVSGHRGRDNEGMQCPQTLVSANEPLNLVKL